MMRGVAWLRNQKGFLLLEVWITGLLLISLCGMFGMYALSLRSAAQSGARVTAVFLAEKQIACLRGNLRGGDFGAIQWQDDGSPPELNGTRFEIRTNATPADDGMALVTVAVCWREKGVPHDYELRTLLAVTP